MTRRRNDVERLVAAIDGRRMRPSALRQIAHEHFGKDARRVVDLALSTGAIVVDTRGMVTSLSMTEAGAR